MIRCRSGHWNKENLRTAADEPDAQVVPVISPEETSNFGGAPQVTSSKNDKVLYLAWPWPVEPSPWPPGKPSGGNLPPQF